MLRQPFSRSITLALVLVAGAALALTGSAPPGGRVLRDTDVLAPLDILYDYRATIARERIFTGTDPGGDPLTSTIRERLDVAFHRPTGDRYSWYRCEALDWSGGLLERAELEVYSMDGRTYRVWRGADGGTRCIPSEPVARDALPEPGQLLGRLAHIDEARLVERNEFVAAPGAIEARADRYHFDLPADDVVGPGFAQGDFWTGGPVTWVYRLTASAHHQEVLIGDSSRTRAREVTANYFYRLEIPDYSPAVRLPTGCR